MIRIETIQMTTNSTEKDVSIDCLVDRTNELIFMCLNHKENLREFAAQ